MTNDNDPVSSPDECALMLSTKLSYVLDELAKIRSDAEDLLRQSVPE